MQVSLTINGEGACCTVEPRQHLADMLRDQLGLTGTHLGCEQGVCGACTVMIDGTPQRACLTFAAACEGTDVRTIEGFESDPLMTRLRAAFSDHHALQCGYCTPGMLISGHDIVRRLPDADERRVREELAGNLCRCTGYAGIVGAIREVQALGESWEPVEQGTAAAVAVAAVRPRTRPQRAERYEPGAPTLHQQVEVAAPPEAVWAVISDPHRVAQALPGAALDRVDPDGTLAGSFAVAIGPIRATFAGDGRVAYDAPNRRGEIVGRGMDRLSRSVADGRIAFAVLADEADASKLDVAITYAVKGPLAQFGRGSVVADVVARLLRTVAHNIATMASGGTLAAPARLGAMELLAPLVRRLLGWLPGLRR